MDKETFEMLGKRFAGIEHAQNLLVALLALPSDSDILLDRSALHYLAKRGLVSHAAISQDMTLGQALVVMSEKLPSYTPSQRQYFEWGCHTFLGLIEIVQQDRS